MYVCICVVSTHLYQWSDRVVQTVVRRDWQVRSGHVVKTAHMIVTPAVIVSYDCYTDHHCKFIVTPAVIVSL